MDPVRTHRDLDAVQLVDVREPDEWSAGHIADAVHIPMDQVDQRRSELADDRPIVTVCRSGGRSGQVAEQLSAAGYDARSMDGGMEAWAREGLPLQSADGGPGRVA